MNKQEQITNFIQNQRKFFRTGQTKDLSFRVDALKKLKKSILAQEKEIFNTLNQDLHRCDVESYVSDNGLVLKEIDYALKRILAWAKPQKIKTPLFHFPASSYILPEPYGVVLIIGPWNAPCQLLLNPLVGAIAAGNCAVLKPSEISVHTSKLMAKIINETFSPDYIVAIEGGVEESQILLEHKFDYIFFTGSSNIGKIITQAAAKHLTPITLELGGKAPCIVDKKVNLKTAARRIIWGKTTNAGQVCMAPDYLLAHQDIKEELLTALKNSIREFYGENPIEIPDYCRIINGKHFDRLVKLLNEGRIFAGGQINKEQKYIAPTIIDDISWDSKIMQEEIFGPILPVISYKNLNEVIDEVQKLPKPLVVYLFSNDKEVQQKVIQNTSSGAVCINDVIVHSAIQSLPFGGVGESGMGKYHGRASFDTFSHSKSIMKKSLAIDPKIRYAPYPKLTKLLKWFFRKFV